MAPDEAAPTALDLPPTRLTEENTLEKRARPRRAMYSVPEQQPCSRPIATMRGSNPSVSYAHRDLQGLTHREVLNHLAEQAADGDIYSWVAQSNIDGRMLFDMFRWTAKVAPFFSLQPPFPSSVGYGPDSTQELAGRLHDGLSFESKAQPERSRSLSVGSDCSALPGVFGLNPLPRIQTAPNGPEQPPISPRSSWTSQRTPASRLSQPFQSLVQEWRD